MPLNKQKFKNKYRTNSFRLRGFDYSSNGYYFVTICTKNREPHFGKIVDGEMYLSEMGRVTKQYWFDIPKHFPFVVLDEFVVMPNHVHGIIVINQNTDMKTKHGVTPRAVVEPQNLAALRPNQHLKTNRTIVHKHRFMEFKNKFGPQSKNLASIIRGFKTGVTKYTNRNQIDFAWQSLFYESIIHNQTALYQIRKYIRNNPARWSRDRNNKNRDL